MRRSIVHVEGERVTSAEEAPPATIVEISLSSAGSSPCDASISSLVAEDAKSSTSRAKPKHTCSSTFWS